jgi:ribose transport system ATP-binding protein
MISSELEELVEGSSRVIVMRDGQRVGELRGAEISQDNIIRAMAEGMGGEATAASTASTHVTDTAPPSAVPPAEGA